MTMEILIPDECCQDMTGGGSKDDVVSYWLKQPIISLQFATLSDEEAKTLGAAHGANDYNGSDDRETNLAYVLWLTAAQLADEPEHNQRDPSEDGWPDSIEDLREEWEDETMRWGYIEA